MLKKLTLAAAGCALVAGLVFVPAAEAGHRDWGFGAGFSVGGLHFRIGFHQPIGHYQRYLPGPFFYTPRALSYPGYGCHGACFRGSRGYYHHADCALVGQHFHRHGYSTGYYLRGYAPRGYYYDRDYWRHGYGRHPSRSHGYYLYKDRHYRDHYRYRDRGRGQRDWRRDRGHYRYRHDDWRYRDDRRYRRDDRRDRRDWRDRRDDRRQRHRHD